MNAARKALAMALLFVLIVTGLAPLAGALGAGAVPAEENGPDASTSASVSGPAVDSHLMTEAEMEEEKARIGVYNPSVDSTATTSGHGTGAVAPTEAQWEAMVGTQTVVDSVGTVQASAGSVDLSQEPYFPEVGDQGQIGSCAAWAETYYAYGYLEAKDNGWTDASTGDPAHLVDPMWTYNLQNGGTDAGSNIGDNTQVIEDIGVPTQDVLPVTTDVTDWGTAAAWREAPLHRAAGFNIITYSESTEINTIKALLDSGTPVNFAINADVFGNSYYADYSGNRNNIISSSEYSYSSFDHENTVVGYYDSVSDNDEIGAFKVVNSWGSSFGNDGYYYITYQAFLKIVRTTTVGYVTDKVDYQPSLLAVWHLDPYDDHLLTRDASITIEAMDTSTNRALAQRSPFIRASYNAFMPTFMCLDITELASYLTGSNREIALTIGSAYYRGEISSFRVERYDGAYQPGVASEISDQSPETLNHPYTPCTVTNSIPSYSGVALNSLLEASSGQVSWSGGAPWVSQVDSGTGDYILQSGDVGDRDESVLRLNVTSPGFINFYWKVSSEATYDFLRFYVNGNEVAALNGSTSWKGYSYHLDGPAHVEWVYEKDDYVSDGDDCGWIRNVTITDQADLDTIAPVTTVQFAGTHGASRNWYTSAVTVTLSATDRGLGVLSTYYQIDGGGLKTYTSPFSISSSGTHTLSYYSVDRIGNIETTRTATIKVDRTAPSTTAKLQGSSAVPGWYNTSVSVTLSAADADSGVKTINYQIDNGSWQTYAHPFSVTAIGTHNIYFYATDNAGMVESTENVQFTIDETPPVTTSTVEGTVGANGGYTSEVNVTLTAADAGPVQWTTYNLDGGDWQTYNGAIVCAAEGTHLLEYFSTDAAGNSETVQNITFKIDAQAPVTFIDQNGPAGERWPLGLIAVIAIVAVLGAYLVVRRRRK